MVSGVGWARRRGACFQCTSSLPWWRDLFLSSATNRYDPLMVSERYGDRGSSLAWYLYTINQDFCSAF
jgi:hypothetical protein